ncbi:unnamed protein product [Adineta ricciae]|uniref:Uncharacterized protein n=1 Tax=Adineta ricciae TaxID=249248 RepID=A0A815Z1M4_ADIRI|nr:unnamed protein product [Adineta ricciae]CAF1576849.1 unnamed protein product [Adineta ricciae]
MTSNSTSVHNDQIKSLDSAFQQDDEEKHRSPGPVYDIRPAIKAVYPSSPSYSLSSRTGNHLGSYDRVPGPGAYYITKLEYYKPRAPGYSFGCRHSPKKSLCLMKCEP